MARPRVTQLRDIHNQMRAELNKAYHLTLVYPNERHLQDKYEELGSRFGPLIDKLYDEINRE